MAVFALGQLEVTRQVVKNQMDCALSNKSAALDLIMDVDKLTVAYTELVDKPLGPGALQACSITLGIAAKMVPQIELRSLLVAYERHRVMSARLIAYRWLEEIVLPRLYAEAESLLREPAPKVSRESDWPLRLVSFLHENIDVSTNGTGSFSVDSRVFTIGLGVKSFTVKRVLYEGTKRADILADTAARVLMAWIGFQPMTKSTHEYIGARFVRDLVGQVGYGALYLPEVWEAFNHPDKKLAGCAGGGKLYVEKEELEDWQIKLEHSPVADPRSDERKQLDAIALEYERISQHHRMPAVVPPRPKPQARPENMLVFLRLALKLVASVRVRLCPLHTDR
jgi:hypothetical protein